ncbi:MAG: DUF3043 domain-containing protein [Actinomycetes bacterium]
MALFRSRNADALDVAEPEPTIQPSGKGRPTPKRRDAEKRRQPVVAPKTRKEASQLQRERLRESRRSSRQGVARGEQRLLAPRDAGPVRAFVRDYVDSHRTVASYFLPLTIVILILGTNPVRVLQLASQGLMLAMFLGLYIDGRRLGRNVVREVERRYPNEPTRGLKWYAVSRALQFRRLRMPKARVKIGDSI